jgi:tripartite-type tricarboxylate transporter receptor subunit TctC
MTDAMKLYNIALFFTVVAHANAALAAPQADAAAGYPNRPIRLIVPYPPGGSVDFTGREVAAKLTEAWGQQVVIDNRGGAGSTLGHGLAAKAAPDGYTLLLGTSAGLVVAPSLGVKISYDPVKDFVSIGQAVNAPFGMTLHASVQANNVREFIALAKAQPGKFNFGSPGTGTPNHLGGELLKALAHINIVHVPYKGGGPAIVDVLAGQVPVTFGTAASVSPHTKSGRLRGLGVTGGRRSAVLPDLPTIAEGGVAGYEMLNWLGLFAPANTPRAIVEKLNGEVMRILRTPEVRERLNAAGAEPAAMATEAFAAFVKSEVDKWAKVVAATGMTPE